MTHSSNHYPLDLIKRNLVAAAVVELRRARRFVVAICCATSSRPPFFVSAVMPVVRKEWQPTRDVLIFAAAALLRIIVCTSC